MPFTIDEDSLLIRGRKGDSASFTFDFEHDISDYTVHFYMKKIDSANAIIEKIYENPTGKAVTVILDSADTQKLVSPPGAYGIYYWGLKLVDAENFYAETIIPAGFKNPPMAYIYPEIGGN